MKKIILGLTVLGLCMLCRNAYSEITVDFYEPGFSYEICSPDFIALMAGMDNEVCEVVDNDGNAYIVPNRDGVVDKIYKIDKYGNASRFAQINTGKGVPLRRIAFDNIEGVMYCLVYDPITPQSEALRLVKISGFNPLSQSQPLQNLQNQIYNIQLIPGPQGLQGIQGSIGPQGLQGEPGPQGEPGITPEEVVVMQSQIVSLQQQIDEIILELAKLKHKKPKK
jgi:hypothetical protein